MNAHDKDIGLIFNSDRGSQYCGGDFKGASAKAWHPQPHKPQGKLLGQCVQRNPVRFIEERKAATDVLCRTAPGQG